MGKVPRPFPLLAGMLMIGAARAEAPTSEQCWIVKAALQNGIETIEKWEAGDKTHLQESIGIILESGGKPLSAEQAIRQEVYDQWSKVFAPARFHYNKELAGQAVAILKKICPGT